MTPLRNRGHIKGHIKMSGLRRKTLLPLIALCVSLSLFFAIAEIGIRLFVEDGAMTPEVLREQSVQYEPALFARYVFPQQARTIIHPWGNKKGIEWEINDKGYRGPDILDPQSDLGGLKLVFFASAQYSGSDRVWLLTLVKPE
jgi:hypothetical protein